MPGQFRVRPVDVSGSISKGLQARNALSQMKESQRQTESRNKLAEMMQGGIPGDSAGQQQLIGAAAQVSPDLGLKVDAHLRSLPAAKLAQRTAEAPLMLGLFSDVKTPEHYAIARAEAAKSGIIDLPEQFDPTVLRASLMGYQRLAPDQGFTLGQGQTRFSRGGAEIASVAPKSKLLTADELAQKKEIARAGKTDIDLGTQEKEEQKAFGKSLVKSYEVIQEAASAAEDTLAQLAIARSIPVETGADAPMRAAIGAYAQALRIDPQSVGLDQVSGAQALTGVMNNLVLTRMQAQKGPQTENDAARIEATLARLGNTPAANDFLFRSAEALAVRDIERAQFYRAHRQETGSFDGAESAWDKHKAQTPLVGTHPETKQPVFYYEFENLVKRANPGASRDQILKLWRSKYDG